ncbi:unnamed protein product [Ostreobium quekettii]|uniref:Chromo domain-containing protein n=1 Tax=Ostreobium quekettii TaxID=121088 RepID=A0A8S1J0T9_9CHLO|nr:unnamed protein product [Ostreobium quekettii]
MTLGSPQVYSRTPFRANLSGMALSPRHRFHNAVVEQDIRDARSCLLGSPSQPIAWGPEWPGWTQLSARLGLRGSREAARAWELLRREQRPAGARGGRENGERREEGERGEEGEDRRDGEQDEANHQRTCSQLCGEAGLIASQEIGSQEGILPASQPKVLALLQKDFVGRGRRKEASYLVRFEGYPPSQDNWFKEAELRRANYGQMVDDYEAAHREERRNGSTLRETSQDVQDMGTGTEGTAAEHEQDAAGDGQVEGVTTGTPMSRAPNRRSRVAEDAAGTPSVKRQRTGHSSRAEQGGDVSASEQTLSIAEQAARVLPFIERMAPVGLPLEQQAGPSTPGAVAGMQRSPPLAARAAPGHNVAGSPASTTPSNVPISLRRSDIVEDDRGPGSSCPGIPLAGPQGLLSEEGWKGAKIIKVRKDADSSELVAWIACRDATEMKVPVSFLHRSWHTSVALNEFFEKLAMKCKGRSG